MSGSVPILSIICMQVSCVVSLGIPIFLLIHYRKKGADYSPFVVGCLVMLVAAILLESLFHSMILSTGLGAYIQSNLWVYAIYGGLVAGLFEETGRYLAFRTVLKRFQDNDVNALMYGAGHGGFEAVVVLGITMVNNLVWSMLINSGNIEALTGSVTGADLEQVEATIQTLLTIPSWEFLVGAVERIFAVILQISLSLLVWFAVKNRKKRFLYPVAVLIHCVVDGTPAVLTGYGVSALAVEGAVGLLAVAAAVYAWQVWKGETGAQENPPSAKE